MEAIVVEFEAARTGAHLQVTSALLRVCFHRYVRLRERRAGSF